MLLLFAMKERLEIKYKAKGHSRPQGDLSIATFMALPYWSDRRLIKLEDEIQQLPLTQRGEQKTKSTISDPTAGPPTPGLDQNLIPKQPLQVPAGSSVQVRSPGTGSDSGSDCDERISSAAIIVRITMPSKVGLLSWRWYEATLEALAVGIYLYATFVLTSAQFLSGQTSLTFAAIMGICMSLVRILGNIF